MDSANTVSNPSISSSPWCEQKPHGHAVQFYTEDKALIKGLSSFIGTALTAGDGAIVIATKAHRLALLQSLEARGVDASSASQHGRFASLDAQETLSRFTINDWPDPMQFAEVIGGLVDRVRVNCQGQNPRVVAFGEMVSLLWEQGKPDAAIALERLWNDLAKIRSFSLRCAYPMAGFARGEHSEPFLKICAEHSSVIPDESYTELHSETARLRDISVLQQKALALRTEAAERRDVQKSLQRRESELADILENAIHPTRPRDLFNTLYR